MCCFTRECSNQFVQYIKKSIYGKSVQEFKYSHRENDVGLTAVQFFTSSELFFRSGSLPLFLLVEIVAVNTVFCFHKTVIASTIAGRFEAMIAKIIACYTLSQTTHHIV